MIELYEWYDRMDERNEGVREHEDGTCGDRCSFCQQEDEYDRYRDDIQDGLRQP